MALGSLARGEKPRFEFSEIEGKLGRLLEEFGPSGAGASRNFPYWHLTTDALWQFDDLRKSSPSRLLRNTALRPRITYMKFLHIVSEFHGNTIGTVQPDAAYFWDTHQSAELDLMLFRNGRRLASRRNAQMHR